MMKMATIFFETCDVDEEVVITFEECLTAAQQDSARQSRPSRIVLDSQGLQKQEDSSSAGNSPWDFTMGS
jgi:hypothetical protein